MTNSVDLGGVYEAMRAGIKAQGREKAKLEIEGV